MVAHGRHRFSECFLIGVAPDGDLLRRCIAVFVEDGALDRRQDEKFIGGQIELDAWKTTGAGSDRPPVAQLALTRHRAAEVFEDVEFLQLFRKVHAGLFVDPYSDFAKYACQEVAVDPRRIGERKIEVFGETVDLELAFLEAGSGGEIPLQNRIVQSNPS